jgi:hypothetical protein
MPDRCSLDPAADGVVGLVAADAASFLDIEPYLLGSGSRCFRGSNIGMRRDQRKCPSAIIAMSPLHRGSRPAQIGFGSGSALRRSRGRVLQSSPPYAASTHTSPHVAASNKIAPSVFRVLALADRAAMIASIPRHCDGDTGENQPRISTSSRRVAVPSGLAPGRQASRARALAVLDFQVAKIMQ